ncbi:MAG: hypothetical protein K2N56_02345 [Oscillospiraceae bacterium]|nr:hypothetical protein [Oscillospiraceae bacterium]
MDIKKHVSNEELLALTKKAFDNDEVAEFLCGEKDYGVHGNPDISADIPTDFGRIVEDGIYKLYVHTKDQLIILKTKSALLQLIGGTPVNVWIAFMIVRRQLSKYDENRAPFNMVDDDVLLSLRKSLYANEVELRECKLYMGANCENGLWQDINRIDQNYKEDMGISVL